ncbi:MAG: DUF3971 domain-containing protein [Alphaproteobacteria bacterium]|nr:DUF3971 domain-containing protein [Alphaproteobacteria bacterium]
MTSIKTGLKITSTLFVFIGLTLLAGLWRLKDAPLRLPVHFDTVRTIVSQHGINFKEIYLFTPSLLSLPGVLIENGHFENEHIQFTADQIFIRWRLRDFFSQKKLWKIDIVHLEKPTLLFKENQSSAHDFEFSDIPLSSLTIKGGRIMNLPNGKTLPAHKVNGTFYKQKGEKSLHVYANTLNENTQTVVEGTMTLTPPYAKGGLKISNLSLKEWASIAPENLQEWFHFFQHPFPEIAIDFHGNSVEKKGTAAVKIHAPFLSQGNRKNVPINLTLEGIDTLSAYTTDLKVETDSFPWEGLSDLWPSFLSPSAHHWCTKRLQGGTATPITLHSQFVYNKDSHHFSIASLTGTLGVKDTTVHYMDGMPPVEETTAEATFSPDDFTIRIVEGTTKKLTVKPKSVVRFYDLSTATPQGLVDLYIDGPLSDTLWVADHPPFRFISPYGFKPKDVSGYSENHLVLKFPAHISPTAKEMTTTFESKISGFDLQMPLLNHTLQLTKGRLRLQMTSNKLSVCGKSLLNGAPSSLYWEENLGPNPKILRHYKVNTTLSLEDFFPFTPPVVQGLCQGPELSFKGPSSITLDYKEFPKDKSHLVLHVDLYQSLMDIPLFNYKKDPMNPGTLDLDLSFHKGNAQKINSLKVTGPDLALKGAASFEKGCALEKFFFNDLKVHESSMKGSLERKKGQWHLSLQGPAIALSPIVDFYQNLPEDPADPSKKSTPLIITADFSKVILQKGITLPPLKARMEWNEEGLHSYGFLIKEKMDEVLSFHYGPQKDKETVEFKTRILSRLLKGFDITETISSGEVSFTLERQKKAELSPFKGNAYAENLRIKGAPILAKLLSLLSIEGILSTLQGDGVLFVRGEADFEYLNKKIAVQHLELASTSLGLTGKGYIDLKEKTLDAEGYIIPANILNQLIGNIPLLGRLVSGNSKEHKGLVSMSYSMKGPLKDPIVSSNPLSALAPNFVKGLFSHLTSPTHKKPTLEAKKAG